MPRHLRRLLGLPQRTQSSFPIPFQQDVTNEVSEHEGILLVRLGRGSAMQVRVQPDQPSVLIRTVPIAEAKQLDGDSTWQAASDSQLWSWIQSDSAIWQWLVAKGFAGDQIARRIAETALLLTSNPRGTIFPALRSKSSLSLP
jgi:hypothetical protein